jgi:hypothetical protein
MTLALPIIDIQSACATVVGAGQLTEGSTTSV